MISGIEAAAKAKDLAKTEALARDLRGRIGRHLPQ
jgi:hypothetical protein